MNLHPDNEASWVQQDTSKNTVNNQNLYLWNKADKAMQQFKEEMRLSDIRIPGSIEGKKEKINECKQWQTRQALGIPLPE